MINQLINYTRRLWMPKKKSKGQFDHYKKWTADQGYIFLAKDKEDALKKSQEGKEQKYTYHGGWDLGYVQGKICEIENIIDELELDEY